MASLSHPVKWNWLSQWKRFPPSPPSRPTFVFWCFSGVYLLALSKYTWPCPSLLVTVLGKSNAIRLSVKDPTPWSFPVLNACISPFFQSCRVCSDCGFRPSSLESSIQWYENYSLCEGCREQRCNKANSTEAVQHSPEWVPSAELIPISLASVKWVVCSDGLPCSLLPRVIARYVCPENKFETSYVTGPSVLAFTTFVHHAICDRFIS